MAVEPPATADMSPGVDTVTPRKDSQLRQELANVLEESTDHAEVSES